MSIKITPFNALYGYEALNFADLDFRDTRAWKEKSWVQFTKDIIRDTTCYEHQLSSSERPEDEDCQQMDWGVPKKLCSRTTEDMD